jgi:hypothetical protein
MARLIVVTGMDQLPQAERWPRLVAPLIQKLATSGLGGLPDWESLRREVEERGLVEATEVAVTLVNFDYGRPLVDRVVEAAGVKHGPVVPLRWHDYHCGEYFTSMLGQQGYQDELAQYWYFWPADRVYEDTDLQFLVIGGPGVDGINWGYRRGQLGLWAYPIDGEFAWLAPTAEALLQGWLAGTISL